MAHLVRSDIPFHYALADAFTICDAYHCSLLGPTDPNRYYMWTGWVGNDGSGGGPVVDNAEAGYGWSTYPELLQNAGISVAAVYQVYSADGRSGPWTYTVAPATELSDCWNLRSNAQTEYDFSVFGPNGFLAPSREASRLAVLTSPVASSTIFKVTVLSWGFTIARQLRVK